MSTPIYQLIYMNVSITNTVLFLQIYPPGPHSLLPFSDSLTSLVPHLCLLFGSDLAQCSMYALFLLAPPPHPICPIYYLFIICLCSVGHQYEDDFIKSTTLYIAPREHVRPPPPLLSGLSAKVKAQLILLPLLLPQ